MKKKRRKKKPHTINPIPILPGKNKIDKGMKFYTPEEAAKEGAKNKAKRDAKAAQMKEAEFRLKNQESMMRLDLTAKEWKPKVEKILAVQDYMEFQSIYHICGDRRDITGAMVRKMFGWIESKYHPVTKYLDVRRTYRVFVFYGDGGEEVFTGDDKQHEPVILLWDQTATKNKDGVFESEPIAVFEKDEIVDFKTSYELLFEPREDGK